VAQIRVLLADDNDFVRESLSALLTSVGGVEVVGACPDGRDVVATAARTRPDVVLLDLAMPHVDGLEAARRLLAAQPDARVIILTAMNSGAAAMEAHELGVRGYLLKSEHPRRLLEAVRTVASGGTVWHQDGQATDPQDVHPQADAHDMA
jgi:DNA-binding NarL/FixJ family response regulator